MLPHTSNINHINNPVESDKSNEQLKTHTGKYKGVCYHIADLKSGDAPLFPFLCIKYNCECPKNITCIRCYSANHPKIDDKDVFIQVQDKNSYVTDSARINVLADMNKYKPVFNKTIGDIKHETYQILQNIMKEEVSQSCLMQEYSPIDAEYVAKNIYKFDKEFTLNTIEATEINSVGEYDRQKHTYLCVDTKNKTFNDDQFDDNEFRNYLIDKSLARYFTKIIPSENKQNRVSSRPIISYKDICAGFNFGKTGHGIKMKDEDATITKSRFIDFRDVLLDMLQLDRGIRNKLEEALETKISNLDQSIKDQSGCQNTITKTFDNKPELAYAETHLYEEKTNKKQTILTTKKISKLKNQKTTKNKIDDDYQNDKYIKQFDTKIPSKLRRRESYQLRGYTKSGTPVVHESYTVPTNRR